jgi:hypothetical protein
MTGTLRVRRSRGALSGVLLVLLGIWGALIPLVGPYFHYAYTPDRAWDFTAGRFWLEQLPGLAVLVGGVIVLASRYRLVALAGSWLAAAGGAWFAVGSLVAGRWSGLPTAGTPTGGAARMALEQAGFFTALGVVITLVAGLAMGRFTVIAARDVATGKAARAAKEPAAETVPAPRPAPESADQPRRFRLPAPVVRRKQDASGQAAASAPDTAGVGAAKGSSD